MSGNDTVISYSTQTSVLRTVRKMSLIESAAIKAGLNKRARRTETRGHQFFTS